MTDPGAQRPTIDLLSPGDAERVVEEACRALARVGILVENEEGSRLLLEGGASLHEGRHRIPEDVARNAVASAPGEIPIYDRTGELALDLGGDRVHFDPGSVAIHVFDSREGRRRAPTSWDVVELVRLVEGLPHYAAQSTALLPGDVPGEIGDRYRLYLALRYGSKPVITGTFSKDGFAPMRDMLAIVRGSEAAVAERPLAILDCCPSPPLRWSDLTCQALIDCARSGIPAELVSMPMAGATAPVTLRAAIVQHCAESLAGIVVHQQASPGAPIIYGGAPSAFDMRRGATPMGAAETMMLTVACARVGKHLGLPTHGYLGLSDAKTPDYQAGLETGVGAILAALAGINVVSGPGMLDYLLTQSAEKLLLDHEACGIALRVVRGVAQRRENVIELLAELVQSGEVLTHRHTSRYWREELSVASPLIDRDSYGDWERKGALTARRRAELEVAHRLAEADIPPLPEEVETALIDRMQSEATRCGLRRLPA